MMMMRRLSSSSSSLRMTKKEDCCLHTEKHQSKSAVADALESRERFCTQTLSVNACIYFCVISLGVLIPTTSSWRRAAINMSDNSETEYILYTHGARNGKCLTAYKEINDQVPFNIQPKRNTTDAARCLSCEIEALHAASYHLHIHSRTY